jgi:hypothetical protein
MPCSLSSPTAPRGGEPVARCPFHDGAATLDLLLAELDPRDTKLFDAALDLRSLCTAGRDATACLRQLLWVRTLLDERHYLAFYRVRCWARRALRIETRPHPSAPWKSDELPLNCARVDEIVNTALAAIAANDRSPATAQVRFTFAPAA